MTTTSQSLLIQTVYMSKRFVEALKERLVFLPLGRREDLPRHVGDSIRWYYYTAPSAATTSLAEGVDPTDSTQLADNAVTGVAATYGAFFETTDRLDVEAVSGNTSQITDLAGYQASLTVDTLCQTLAVNTATNQTDAGTAMTAEAIRLGVYAVRNRLATPHPATPGGAFWCGVLSEEQAHDMMGEGAPTWVQAKNADLSDSLLQPWKDTPASAALYNVMIKVSTNIQTSGSDDLGYILGADSFGVSALDSNLANPEILISPMTPSLASPLARRGTYGWKLDFDAELIDDNRLQEMLSDQS